MMDEIKIIQVAQNRASDRSFGLVMTLALIVIGLAPRLKGHPLRIWAIELSLAFFLTTLLRPSLLGGLNQGWFWLGVQLQRLTTPVVLGVAFFFVLTPMAWVLRLFSWDGLRLRIDRQSKSYWITRKPSDSVSNSFLNQF